MQRYKVSIKVNGIEETTLNIQADSPRQAQGRAADLAADIYPEAHSIEVLAPAAIAKATHQAAA